MAKKRRVGWGVIPWLFAVPAILAIIVFAWRTDKRLNWDTYYRKRVELLLDFRLEPLEDRLRRLEELNQPDDHQQQ
jgi:hypothetical protein